MQNEEQMLEQQITELKAKLESLENQLDIIYLEKSKKISERVKSARKGLGDFKSEELIFAALSRCPCGAGLAYPKDIGINGAWNCSAILMGIADTKTLHEDALPFAFYEVKSELQPSANGATTRPK